jgi:hypothetical protein
VDVVQVTLEAPPDKVLVNVGFEPWHIEKSAPTLIALKLLMVTGLRIVILPQAFEATKPIVFEPVLVPGPGTLTVMLFVPAPEVILKPGGTAQEYVSTSEERFTGAV